MTFYKRLEKHLGNIKIKQNEIAEIAGVTPASVNEWKNEGTTPRTKTVIKIANHFNIPLESLINDGKSSIIPAEILEIARKIALLEPHEREEIMLVVEHKLKRSVKALTKPNDYGFTADSHPVYSADINTKPTFSIPDRDKIIDNVIFVVKVPILGSTAAGCPIDFGDIDPDPPTWPWPVDLIKGDPRNYYCVTVIGTSMSDADIMDGDYALLKRADGAENGEIMLVRHDNSSTLKRIKIVEGRNGREEVWI